MRPLVRYWLSRPDYLLSVSAIVLLGVGRFYEGNERLYVADRSTFKIASWRLYRRWRSE